jgi:hypothetical protein
VYFFSIFVFGFSLTGSINRPRRQSDRASSFCGKGSGHATPFSQKNTGIPTVKKGGRFTQFAFKVDTQIIPPFLGWMRLPFRFVQFRKFTFGLLQPNPAWTAVQPLSRKEGLLRDFRTLCTKMHSACKL